MSTPISDTESDNIWTSNRITGFIINHWVLLCSIGVHYLFSSILSELTGRPMPAHAFLIAIIFWVFMGYYNTHREIKSLFGSRMFIYVSRRLLAMIPIFLGVAILTFSLMNFIGNPVDLLLARQRFPNQAAVDALTHRLGLDRPASERFFDWLGSFLIGDLGTSFKRLDVPIVDIIGDLAFETLKLQFIAFIVALVIAIPLGVVAANNQGSPLDAFTSSIALLGLSMPIFVTGITLILIFGGAGLNWFPSSGAHQSSLLLPSDNYLGLIATGQIWTAIKNWYIITKDSAMHMVLPTVTLAFAMMATYTRLMRTSMLEVLNQDYILAARSNGLPERTVIWKHAFRNCLIPIVTFIGLFVAFSLAGAPITETVFSWPGLGKFYVKAALVDLDYAAIMGITLLLTVITLIANLLTDIAYVFLDPRIELD
jgi:peptide/nickel transport system permease protein